jgi:hypothetical protein
MLKYLLLALIFALIYRLVLRLWRRTPGLGGRPRNRPLPKSKDPGSSDFDGLDIEDAEYEDLEE